MYLYSGISVGAAREDISPPLVSFLISSRPRETYDLAHPSSVNNSVHPGSPTRSCTIPYIMYIFNIILLYARAFFTLDMIVIRTLVSSC